MVEYEFEWDNNKAKTNIKKHEISFDEAISVFEDEYSLIYYDIDHSINENRYISLGSNDDNVLVVCYCLRNNGNTIRIISARKATTNEIKTYYKYGKGENI